jgi:hypothetical protein
MPSISRATVYGSVGEDVLGGGAVVADEFHALAGRDAVGLEKNIQLPLGTLFVPGLFDREGAFFPDAVDVAQPARFLAKDAEGVRAECVDDLVGVDLADAGDEAAAEVFADAIHAGRQLAAKAGDLELRSVLRVPRPFATQVQRLSALHPGQGADDRDGFGARFGSLLVPVGRSGRNSAIV